MKDIWLWWQKADLRTEYKQLAEEGRDTRSVEAQFQHLQAEHEPVDEAFQQAADELLLATIELPTLSNYRYVEPSDLEGIRAERPDGPRSMALPASDTLVHERIAGAWLGRCAGCLLGKPIECRKSPQVHALLERSGSQEITDYLWRLPGVSDEAYRELGFEGLLNWRTTACMPEDDDTNYTVTGMAVVKQKGPGFTPEDVANFWMQNIPILHTCTAERVAYRNFINNIGPPQSAMVRNPYREWIGAQIRADFFGYVAVGRPELAAQLAWRDACISHTKNGIYGEMWVAAMLAAAAVESDPVRVIEIGLSEIPANCRLAEGVRAVLQCHATGVDYYDAVKKIHTIWDENQAHDWCHTISNAQIVALGLVYGAGDYERAITRAVYPCFDTDCNGATVGSIMGMLLGVRALPEKWTAVMQDTIHTGLAEYQKVSISELADEMFRLSVAAREYQP